MKGSLKGLWLWRSLAVAVWLGLGWVGQVQGQSTALQLSERLKTMDKQVSDLIKTQPASAYPLAWDLLDAAGDEESVSMQSRAYSYLSAICLRTNNLDSTVSYARLAIDFSLRSGDSAQMAFAYNSLGNAFDGTGKPDSALIAYEQSLAFARAKAIHKDIARSLLNIGMIQLVLGKYPESLESLHAAKQVCERHEIPNYLPIIALTMGEVYLMVEERDLAFDYLHVALQFGQAAGNPMIIGRTCIALGGYAEEIGDFQEANCWYMTARQVTNAAGLSGLEAKAAANLASSSLALGDYPAAEEAIKHAITIAERDHDIISLGLSYQVAGLIHLQQKRYAPAFQNCSKSYAIAYEVQQFNAILPLCECMWQSAEKLGRYQEAFKYHREYVQWHDSLVGEKSAMDIARLEARIDFERQHVADSLRQVTASLQQEAQHQVELADERVRSKLSMWGGSFALLLALLSAIAVVLFRRQNKQLGSQNELIKDQNTAIQTALAEKEVLLQEVHHRVKNNLQVMMSLLDLQSDRIEDQQAKAALLASKGRVQAMTLIHQKLYQQENLAEVEFGTYLQQVVEALQALFPVGHQVQVDYQIVPCSFGIDIAVPLGLILNELVTNAFKYAYNGRATGKLRLTLKRSAVGMFELWVEDDGPGLPRDRESYRSGSLGMQLVRGLARQLQGDLQMGPSALGGAKCSISFSAQPT